MEIHINPLLRSKPIPAIRSPINEDETARSVQNKPQICEHQEEIKAEGEIEKAQRLRKEVTKPTS